MRCYTNATLIGGPDPEETSLHTENAIQTMAFSAAAIKARAVKKWLVDTGCGHDLISRRELPTHGNCLKAAQVPITFDTANGETHTTEVADIFIKQLNADILPYVLEETPAAISVGYRCIELGYSFFWPNGATPYFVNPENKRIYLEVRERMPYLRPGAALCQPRAIPDI